MDLVTLNSLFAIHMTPEDRNIILSYAEKWGARIQYASTHRNDEHIVAVLHDDHVFAAASSKSSQADAFRNLAGRIRAKSV